MATVNRNAIKWVAGQEPKATAPSKKIQDDDNQHSNLFLAIVGFIMIALLIFLLAVLTKYSPQIDEGLHFLP